MSRPRKLTAIQESEIWNQFQNGVKIKLIAVAMGLPYQLVYMSIKRERDSLESITSAQQPT